MKRFAFVLLGWLLSFGVLAADCTPGQHQYSVGPVYGAGPFTGTTIAAACAQVPPYTGGTYAVGPGALQCTFSIDAGTYRAVTELCTTPSTGGGTTTTPTFTASGAVLCTGTCTLILTPGASAVNDTHIVDMSTLAMLFLCAGIVIVCFRKLGDLFRVDHDKG